MADVPVSNRRFNDEEVALIIKRAAELQQTEAIADESTNALTLAAKAAQVGASTPRSIAAGEGTPATG